VDASGVILAALASLVLLYLLGIDCHSWMVDGDLLSTSHYKDVCMLVGTPEFL
jgi:hypothetical protein